MKKLLSLLFATPLFINIGHIDTLEESKITSNLPLYHQQFEQPHDSIDVLVDALIYVESRGKDDAIGDTHLGKPSIGVLQIRPIMVREVNRILRKSSISKSFKLKDRFNRQKSIEMFKVWKNHHHPEDGFEMISRNWNGGSHGYKKKRTEKYWVKVQKQLKNLKNHL